MAKRYLLAYFFFKLLWVFLAMMHSLWELSSLKRDCILAPAVKAPSSNHWTARELPKLLFFLVLV